ncbi:MAG: DUF1799 domain-containing protein [Desulfovibrionaceae bacterium]|nr:DUF1799 domain-containing protein [Desulfovibrionaceae bacterium]
MLAVNEPVWDFWLKIQTQWRAGMALVGLDYPAVLATAQVYGISMTPELFRLVQLLEMDVLEEQAEGMRHGQKKD